MALSEQPAKKESLPWRGIAAGTLGVMAIGLCAPVNDWVMRNTPLVGSFLSIGVLTALIVLIGVVNGVVGRWLPAARMGQRDLTAALVLLLAGSSFASVGLVRYLPGYLALLWEHVGSNAAFAGLVGALDLPDWLFPVGGPVERRGDSTVVRHFFTRTPGAEAGIVGAISAVPWAAWAKPVCAWGVLIGCMALSLVAALMIFLPQWSQVERLPFPLARVYTSLIEPPERGRVFNATLSSPRFWVAFTAVFFVHLNNGLSAYTAGAVPRIPLGFDLTTTFTEGSWQYVEYFFKQQTIYFSIVGMMFFVQTRRVASLWLAMVLLQIVRMILGNLQTDFTYAMGADEQGGAIVAMAGVTLFLARRHVWAVARHCVGLRARGGETTGRWAGWCVAIGVAGQVVWLHAAGASVAGALVIVLLLLLLLVTVARTLAETGIPYLLLPLDLRRFTTYAAWDVPGIWKPTSGDVFWSGMTHGLFTHDTRESVAGFASTAMRCDEQSPVSAKPAGRRRLLVALLALGLGLGYVASWAGYLTADYRYAATLDRGGLSPINDWGAWQMPRALVLDSLAAAGGPPNESHNRLLHLAIGAAGLIGLTIASVQFAGWPLHPVGFLLVHSWGTKVIWFSIFLGWLMKVVIVRLGGAKLLQAAHPVCIGLILGEACSAAFWLLYAVGRLIAGMDFERILLLPT